MTHEDINDLETRDYIFKIGDRGKGIQARYDENTDALIFPRAAFDYVYKLLKEALSQEQKSGKWILTIEDWNKWTCSKCGYVKRTDIHVNIGWKYCPNCGAKMESEARNEVN